MSRAFLTLISILLLVGAAGQASAQSADLNISPKRIVMQGGQRSAVVHIFNQGDAPATYTIALVDHVMGEDGEIRPVAEGAVVPIRSAADLVSYTPRRIVLQPRQSQSIRLRTRRAEAPGEYRTHLVVTALPPEDAGFTAVEAASGDAGALAFQVIAQFSLSIPVIVREGAVAAHASFENVRFIAPRAAGEAQRVAFDLTRQGEGSVYGDIEIFAGQGRAERLVGKVRGIAVYPEIQRRPFVATLDQAVRPHDSLRIVYRDDEGRPGTPLATATLVTP